MSSRCPITTKGFEERDDLTCQMPDTVRSRQFCIRTMNSSPPSRATVSRRGAAHGSGAPGDLALGVRRRPDTERVVDVFEAIDRGRAGASVGPAPAISSACAQRSLNNMRFRQIGQGVEIGEMVDVRRRALLDREIGEDADVVLHPPLGVTKRGLCSASGSRRPRRSQILPCHSSSQFERAPHICGGEIRAVAAELKRFVFSFATLGRIAEDAGEGNRWS